RLVHSFPTRRSSDLARSLTLSFGGEERLEHPGGDLLRDAGPRVGDADRDAVARAACRDPDPSRRGVARDGLTRVVDHVHEYLLDLVSVHLDFGQAGLHLERRL